MGTAAVAEPIVTVHGRLRKAIVANSPALPVAGPVDTTTGSASAPCGTAGDSRIDTCPPWTISVGVTRTTLGAEPKMNESMTPEPRSS